MNHCKAYRILKDTSSCQEYALFYRPSQVLKEDDETITFQAEWDEGNKHVKVISTYPKTEKKCQEMGGEQEVKTVTDKVKHES